MSLLDDFAHKCILMEKKRTPDGAGGYITAWEEGADGVNMECVDYNNYAPGVRAEMRRLLDGPFRFKRRKKEK